MKNVKTIIISLFVGIIISSCIWAVAFFSINISYKQLEEQNREFRSTINRIGKLADREEYLIGIERNIIERERDINNRVEFIYKSIRTDIIGARDDIDAIEKIIRKIEEMEQVFDSYNNH